MSKHVESTTFAELIQRGVLEIGDGYRAKVEELGGNGPIFLRAGLLTGRGFDWGAAEHFHADSAKNLSSKFGHPGDTMVTTKGNSVGRAGFVLDDFPEFVYSPHLSYWRSLDHIRLAPGFLRYWSRSPEFLAQLRSMASSTDMAPYLSLSDQRRLQMSLPDIDAQLAIARVLGAFDDKTSVNDQIVSKSRELITLKYRESVALGVTSARIGEIAELFDGPHATPRKTEFGPWFLSISSLNGGRLLLDESAHLSEDDFAQWTRRVTPQSGDILFSYETRLGEAALMPTGIRACLGRRMALLRPRGIGSRTLLQAFLAPSFQDAIRKYSVHGATVERIPLTEFSSWRMDLPTQESYQLESILAPLDDLAQERERENETLAALRDALLPKLMSGAIRVRDAEKVVEDVT